MSGSSSLKITWQLSPAATPQPCYDQVVLSGLGAFGTDASQRAEVEIKREV